MRVAVTEELRSICRRIIDRQYSEDEWARTASDAFQTEHYAGGFDQLEGAFCFSYFAPEHEEFWFQFTLATAKRLANGEDVALEARPAERAAHTEKSNRTLPRGRFAKREDWAKAYLKANPEAHPLEMIGDYNGTKHLAELGPFTLPEAQLLADQVRSRAERD